MEEDPYGYDPDTDTVRVSRRDLAQVLMQFRAEIERGRSGPWFHMADYDQHLERLADAVDYGSAVAADSYDAGPDFALRCKQSGAYVWPAHPPYDGGRVEVVTIRFGSAGLTSGTAHYAYWEGPRVGRSLCGFTFSRDNAAPADLDEPDCWACVRESLLAADVAPGRERWQ